MRPFIVAALVTACAMVASTGCGKGGEAAEVPVNAAAGRVVELTGKVEATRGGATRVLAVGHEVFRDDVVATNDGAVTIELFHNQARWVVDAAKTRRVDESAAWGLAKQERPSSSSQHPTSAAGRNGERTAADTAATAHSELKRQKDPTVEENAADKAKSPDADGGKTGASQGSAQPPKTEVPAQPPPPPIKQDSGLPKGDRETKLDPRGPVQPALSLAAQYERERAKLVACLDATTKKLTLQVTVRAGVGTVAMQPGIPATVMTCLSQVVAAVRVTGEGTAKIELSR